ncbi:membrane-associated guanylate kinase, WW and PDZ domain-containing protein 1-like isoform X4 [Trichoplusia ni]|uniref:Membrane-associated guanylate kinase, WW and PDZ domain-containing protein 1-like isoform X4 n=1 Tax=Trichoplusia ni TaxID=7111 RepID=A0A7E5W0M6_TRINI|nr:membrane-associated guanylate kinase, WW and PDZ domain-containing protein 1-like isoform X4 [Trichoplusia ni]
MAQSSVDSDRLSSAGISTHSSGTAGTVGGSVVGVRPGDAGLKRGEDEDEYNLGPLPPMWEKTFTPSGEVYFIDHNTGTSHWLDPRLARVRKHSLGECGEDELPFGWERVTDERYGSYYVDHINRRTQYENPVLQARRIRADKLSSDNAGNGQSNGTTPTGDLRGERFTLTLTKGTQGLGFTLIGAEGIPETEGYLQIRSIVPHSPAWIDGALRPGDVVVGVGNRGVRGLSHAHVAQVFQSIAPGTDVTLHLVRGYPLSFDSEDPNTRVLSTLAVDATTPPTSDAVAMQQLTRALRTRFNLDSPNLEGNQGGRDKTDGGPMPPHSPGQRRLMSRSFDLDELTINDDNQELPRCPSLDHVLSLANEPGPRASSPGRGAGRELLLSLRRGAAGFGFTIADSVHGQKVKKVLDRSRCAGLREGDLLLQIGETPVRHAPHQHVVQVLKDCPALQETTLRVWRRSPAPARAPRSRSATRLQPQPVVTNNNIRSKTPTAEQLRSPNLHTQDSLRDRLNGMNSEATYAVPEHKNRERESLIDRRRRSSTPGGRLTLPVVTPWTEPQPDNQWQERETWLDNSNIRNWAENAQKWDENGQKWDENTQKWEQNGQKWDENNQKWEQNGQKWDENTQKWEQNGQKWEENGQKWEENGQKWVENGQKWDESANGNRWGNNERWGNGNWGEVPTPTVHVDMNAAYWRGNASVADSSDNGGFPEDGMLHSPTTAAIGGLNAHRQSPSTSRMGGPHSPSNSTGRLRSHSPSNTSATDHLLANSPSTRLQSQSPSNNSSNSRIKSSPLRLRETSPSRHMHSPVSRQSPSCYENESLAQPNQLYVANYPQVEAGGAGTDPAADVLVRLARAAAGFGFRIVGGTEDGSRVAVGYVVPGGPADGLLRPGDLLTSVDGIPLAGATHTRAVSYVCQAASRGHVTLGVRHNRADIQPLGLPAMVAPHAHQPLLTAEPAMHGSMPPVSYNILHPAPMYPPAAHVPMYGVQYDTATGGWASVPYDVTVTRNEGEGFGFVVISSANKAISTIGQLIPNSPAARCGLLHVGDTIVAINHAAIRNLPHPEVVALIKRSGTAVTLTVLPPERHDALERHD